MQVGKDTNVNHFYVSTSKTNIETDNEIPMPFVECLINKTHVIKHGRDQYTYLQKSTMYNSIYGWSYAV